MDIWEFYASKKTEKRIKEFLITLSEENTKQDFVDLLNDLAANSYDLGATEGAQAEEYAREAAWEKNHEEF